MGSIDGKEMTSVKSDVGSLHISNFIKFHKWFSNRFLDGFKAFCTIAKPQFVVKKHDTRHGPVSSWSFPIFARLHRLTASQRGLARRAARAEGRVVPGGPIDDLYGR